MHFNAAVQSCLFQRIFVTVIIPVVYIILQWIINADLQNKGTNLHT